MKSGWNMADVWERNAERFPDAVAQMQSTRSYTWTEFDQRADGVAHALLRAGLKHQDKVAQYLYNGPEYLESVFACFKGGLVPVNTNYRYTSEELLYLWDNSDARAVVFHSAFSEQCESLRTSLPNIKLWLCVTDDGGGCPPWAAQYESAAATTGDRQIPTWGRSPDDVLMMYTGGTTGMPKGVIWRQDDLLMSLNNSWGNRLPEEKDWAAYEAAVTKPGPRNLPAAPLMHGTGLFNAMWILSMAGSVVLLQSRSFNPEECLEATDTFNVNSITLVGDAMTKPIMNELDAHPGRWKLASLKIILSSGVMWSAASKRGLLRHYPSLFLVDALGSSEAIGMASSVSTIDTSPEEGSTVAEFKLSHGTQVLTPEGRPVGHGTGEKGLVAHRGRTPIGYYKDDTKSQQTFIYFDGVRWSIPGDWAEVGVDGTLRLLGRGSQCINTGGEKVFPEEVEETLKTHPGVTDAAVIGLPDERFGQRIVALIVASDTAHEGLDFSHFVRERLAAYKAPKQYFTVTSLNRGPNGKLDYATLSSIAATRALESTVPSR
jgi:acyl-CoA synthetase (AMP-forming)/AMP-acid ligase II